MSVQIFGKAMESDSLMQIKVLQYVQGGCINPDLTIGSSMWNKE